MASKEGSALSYIKNRIRCLLFSVLVLFASLFTTGQPPKIMSVPDTEAGEFGRWVDPFIGTGGIPWACAMLSPGASAPFGMVRLSPDTSFVGGAYLFKTNTSGYYYNHNYILGFSHTRLSGTGVTDMGHFRVTPSVGNADPSKRLKKPLLFSHEREDATSGYYTVSLPTIGCVAELTASDHCGFHRYTFGTSKDAHIFIDATSALGDGRAEEGRVNVLPDTMEIEGEGRVFTGFTGRYGGLKGYFVARFNMPFESYATWDSDGTLKGRPEAFGDDTGADLNFGDISGKPLELSVGISFVSLENARENLDAETGGKTFEQARAATRGSWEDMLSRIKIETADSEVKTIFYTSLYRSMLMPGSFTDVNGEYLGFNGQIGHADGFIYRTDMSLWDSFRTVHPLFNMIAREIETDCLNSLVSMAKVGGSLPRWPSGGGYTGSMFGTPADMVITESYLKGITGFDVETAYEFMKKTSEQGVEKDGRDNIDAYNQYGYVPADMAKNSVSKTLEYAWADGSIALLAQALGKDEEAAYYKEKCMNYKNIFNPETKYFQGKNTDGSWVVPLLPNFTSYYDEVLIKKVSHAYCEGSARQWRWSVPQDPQGMIELFGGSDYFVRELDKFMSDASKNRAAVNPGAGYWHGNQHNLHAAYLFNDAGRSDLSQKWVRWILDERYSRDIDGLDGNDDGGTLCSWYVLSALGIYPVAGTDKYWIGSPNIESASISLGGGKTLDIVVENQSKSSVYVQSAVLNGEPLSAAHLSHSQISGGGVLKFVMGDSPAQGGGFAKSSQQPETAK